MSLPCAGTVLQGLDHFADIRETGQHLGYAQTLEGRQSERRPPSVHLRTSAFNRVKPSRLSNIRPNTQVFVSETHTAVELPQIAHLDSTL